MTGCAQRHILQHERALVITIGTMAVLSVIGGPRNLTGAADILRTQTDNTASE
ncbi:2678_t:CDS:1, partial [Ambispora gerdemannii]